MSKVYVVTSGAYDGYGLEGIFSDATVAEEFRKQITSLHERIQKNYINKVGIDFGILKVYPFDGKFYFEQITPITT